MDLRGAHAKMALRVPVFTAYRTNGEHVLLRWARLLLWCGAEFSLASYGLRHTPRARIHCKLHSMDLHGAFFWKHKCRGLTEPRPVLQ